MSRQTVQTKDYCHHSHSIALQQYTTYNTLYLTLTLHQASSLFM